MTDLLFGRFDLAIRVAPSTSRFAGYMLAPVPIAWLLALIFAWPRFIESMYFAWCVLMWGAAWFFSRNNNFGERARDHHHDERIHFNPATVFFVAGLTVTLLTWVECYTFIREHWVMPAVAFFFSAMAAAAVGCTKAVVFELLRNEKNDANVHVYASANKIVTVTLGLIGMVWLMQLLPPNEGLKVSVAQFIVLIGAAWWWAAFQNWRDKAKHIQVHMIKPITVSVDDTTTAKSSRLSRSVWATYLAMVLSTMLFLLCWRTKQPYWEYMGLALACTAIGMAAVIGAKFAAAVTMRAYARANANG